ncbi:MULTISPECIES: hypothetical protein [Clostridium]|uniref:Uncharacterized protein n=1 Tax=Clostridium intestinale DSM 6191 TaxID=1121320 RepID=A0A1M6FB39_9CLOT|nr:MULTISPECIES: hypothetical protein [Clostridium]SHI94885.1 hypothetical protein SAMN02745941_04601 [Clostridium intestinale DSM 6191]
MKKSNVCLIDIMVIVLGIMMILFVKNSTRFIGVGLISLAFTYLLRDRYNIIKKLK